MISLFVVRTLWHFYKCHGAFQCYPTVFAEGIASTSQADLGISLSEAGSSRMDMELNWNGSRMVQMRRRVGPKKPLVFDIL